MKNQFTLMKQIPKGTLMLLFLKGISIAAAVAYSFYNSFIAFFLLFPLVYVYVLRECQECMKKKKIQSGVQFADGLSSVSAALFAGYSVENAFKEAKKELELLYETYKSCGYHVIFSSTFNGDGLDEIREILQGKTTVVAGPSGVGKSSITNALQENVQMETGEISKKLKRGKHTTRHSQVIPVGHDTYLMDTPGFSSLYLTDIEEQELKDYFPEFRKYEDQCRFQGCRHIHEPDCGVKEALAEHKISQLRYEDYLGLYDELKEKRRF